MGIYREEFAFGGAYFVKSNIKAKEFQLPFFDYDKQPILNLYIPKIPIIGGRIDYTLHTNDVLSQSNIANLYKSGFNFIKQIVPHKKEFVAVKMTKPNEIDAYYFGERYQETNDNKIKRTFNSDFGFLIGTGVSPAPMQSFSVISIDFYGMARVGNTWKGARIRF